MTPSSPPATARGSRQAVAVDDLEVGMILAEDVLDQQGRLLLPSGSDLTDRHLRAFQMMGILAVKVRGTGAEPPEPVLSPEILAEAEARVRARLHNNDLEQPVIAEIYRFAVQREARRLAAGERPHA
jgi:hypothetical protein